MDPSTTASAGYTPEQAASVRATLKNLTEWLTETFAVLYGQRPPEVPSYPGTDPLSAEAQRGARLAAWIAAGSLPGNLRVANCGLAAGREGLVVLDEEAASPITDTLSNSAIPWATRAVTDHLGVSARAVNVALKGGGQARRRDHPASEFWRLSTLLESLYAESLDPAGSHEGKRGDSREKQRAHASGKAQSVTANT